MKAQFSQKMSGERKAVIQAVGTILGAEVKYTGAPSFAYEADAWSINRNGYLASPVIDMDNRGPTFYAELMDRLSQQGFAAEDQLLVAVYPDAYNPSQLGNIQAILAGKATLLQHALGSNTAPVAALVDVHVARDILVQHDLDGGFVISYSSPSLTADGITALLQLSVLVCAQAAILKQVRTKDNSVENEKYAMRCFLLRIGMIGAGYATARKELLRRLSGDSSFKSGPRPAETPAEGVTAAAAEEGAKAQESGQHGLELT